MLCDTLISKSDPDPHSDPYNWDYNAPGDNPDGTCQQSAQGYDVVVPASAPDTGLNCFAEGPTSFTNFAFSINMQVVKSSASQAFDAGIAFRCPQTPDTCYEFTVDGSGNYSLYAYANGQAVTGPNIPTTDHSPLFHTTVGSVNQLAIQVKNKTISLFINGHFLTSVTDATSASGRIGVTEDAAKTGTVEVLFSDAKVWSL
ncbi:MAG TPA: family 16 glycoside hydrolase [Ktedonobacterales bacterium]|nr:family 16 glycoside hydrolase [Ktedonobacterales bacterium]